MWLQDHLLDAADIDNMLEPTNKENIIDEATWTGGILHSPKINILTELVSLTNPSITKRSVLKMGGEEPIKYQYLPKRKIFSPRNIPQMKR